MGAPLIPHSHGKFMAMEKPCKNLCFRISAAAMQHTHRNNNSIQQKMYLCNGNLPVSAAPRAGAIPPGTALSRPHRTVLEAPGRRGARLPAAPGLAPARRIALTTRDPAPKPGGHPALTLPSLRRMPLPCNAPIYMYVQNTYGHGDTAYTPYICVRIPRVRRRPATSRARSPKAAPINVPGTDSTMMPTTQAQSKSRRTNCRSRFAPVHPPT